jgi:trehalose 6-phosphate synthase/phosphatase
LVILIFEPGNTEKHSYQFAVFMDNTERRELLEKYRKATNRLVLLDYDGTLVNYELIPGDARLSDHLLDILSKLINKPRTEVFIISGRGHQDIDKLLHHLPINIIAEHGAMMKKNGFWKDQMIDNRLWKNSILPILNQTAADCPKSFVEEKKFSLTWHYRNADQYAGYSHSRELISSIEKYISLYNLKILDGNKVVEIMRSETGKGIAVKKLVEEDKFDYILSIGDDVTDEEIFELFLSDTNSYTIKVGNGSTFAKHKFDTVDEVVLFLNDLSE